MPAIHVFNETIQYDVIESEDATEPRIDVDIHGVRIILPAGSAIEAETVANENAQWILDKWREYETHRQRAPARSFEEGELFPYLGEEYEVVIEQRSSSSVGDGTLRLAKHHVEATSIKRALETLYRRNARQRFERRVDYFTEQMGVEHERIEVRNQRTKWGSCSSNGTLGLNWRLIMAPPEIVDYVVVHELAHLREQNHTNRFWRIIEERLPDYRERANWLDEHGVELIFTEDDL